MNELLFCGTLKLLEIFVETSLSLLVEYFITELVKESINQANKEQKAISVKN